jgi:type IV secretory pathway TrbD component
MSPWEYGLLCEIPIFQTQLWAEAAMGLYGWVTRTARRKVVM